MVQKDRLTVQFAVWRVKRVLPELVFIPGFAYDS